MNCRYGYLMLVSEDNLPPHKQQTGNICDIVCSEPRDDLRSSYIHTLKARSSTPFITVLSHKYRRSQARIWTFS